MQISRCEGHMHYELDHEPPLEVLQRLAATSPEGDPQSMSHSLFLGIVIDELDTDQRSGDILTRNLTGIDPQRGPIAVGEQLRHGQRVQFHLRDALSSSRVSEPNQVTTRVSRRRAASRLHAGIGRADGQRHAGQPGVACEAPFLRLTILKTSSYLESSGRANSLDRATRARL